MTRNACDCLTSSTVRRLREPLRGNPRTIELKGRFLAAHTRPPRIKFTTFKFRPHRVYRCGGDGGRVRISSRGRTSKRARPLRRPLYERRFERGIKPVTRAVVSQATGGIISGRRISREFDPAISYRVRANVTLRVALETVRQLRVASRAISSTLQS